MSPSYTKGELILTSKPFVHVLENTERGNLCDYCFRRNMKLQRCSRCSFMYFCDRECQCNAWPLHKHECSRLKSCFPNTPPTSCLRMMCNIIFKLKTAKDEYEEIEGHYRTFNDLESHVVDIKQDAKRIAQFQGVYSALGSFLGEKHLPSPAEVFDMFGKMVINSFSICNAEMQIIGSGLYLGASIVDHSCEPNAVAIFDGNILHMRAIQDIPCRSIKSVFISYIDQMETRVKRQQQFQEQYYFTCMCIRCSTNNQNDEMLVNPAAKEQNLQCIAKSTASLEVLKKLKKEKKDPVAILNSSLRLLKEQEEVMLPANVLHVRVQDIAFDACIELCRWKQALNIGLQTLDSYRYYYGNFHPCLGIQLFRIGKIQLFLGKLKDAEETLIQGEEVLRTSHGTNHYLYKDLIALLAQCQDEIFSKR